MTDALTVLVVDDDARHRGLYAQTLRDAGFRVEEAPQPATALEAMAGSLPDMVVSDVRMPGMTGLEFLQQARGMYPELPFLLVTAFPDVRGAVKALKLGAVDYLEKPVDLDELTAAVSDALHVPAASLGDDLPVDALDGIVVQDCGMLSILRDCYRVAASQATILITGESGTGKEVLAQFIHRHSSRSGAPFIAVNCAAIPANLLASELFGHVKGAFTGADGDRNGRFREADGGTLFLDEIGDMPLELQTSLLRAVETSRITPLGSDKEIDVDIRLLAATNQKLKENVRTGKFREDLYYRLNVIAFELPPLRERPDDILALAKHFLNAGSEPKRLSPAAARAMTAYDWPGNVRELANAAERARILSTTEIILPEHLPPNIRSLAPKANVADLPPVGTMEEVEQDAIRRALTQTNGNRTHAADLLGISRRALIYKIKRYGLR